MRWTGWSGRWQLGWLQFLSRIGTPVFFESDAEVPPLSSETTLHLYRIVQEAVNNALKHANAQHIWIRLAYKQNQITLTVRDDGVGLPETLEAAEAPQPQSLEVVIRDTQHYVVAIKGNQFMGSGFFVDDSNVD